jgi:hypothetical protein
VYLKFGLYDIFHHLDQAALYENSNFDTAAIAVPSSPLPGVLPPFLPLRRLSTVGREGACSTMMQASEEEGGRELSVKNEYRCYQGLFKVSAILVIQKVFSPRGHAKMSHAMQLVLRLVGLRWIYETPQQSTV